MSEAGKRYDLFQHLASGPYTLMQEDVVQMAKEWNGRYSKSQKN